MKYVLTIAGSDSSGGAGIQADIKTITSLKAHALTAITAVTAQNSLGITLIHKIPARVISKQIDTILEDVLPDAVKIGMLYTASAVREVAKIIEKRRLRRVVLDPILAASSGPVLLKPEAIPLVRDILLPRVTVVTPNIYEAGVLTGMQIDTPEDMAKAAKSIRALGPAAVITGGHLAGKCVDILYDGEKVRQFAGSKIMTEHTHGTGCVFSTALSVFLAGGMRLAEATKQAHEFARSAIIKGYKCGRGPGPVQSGSDGRMEPP